MIQKQKRWIYSLISVCIIWGVLNIIAYVLRIPALNRVCFFSAGLMSLVLIYQAILYSGRACGVRMQKLDWLFFSLAVLISFSLYAFLIYSRQIIYTWDNVGYYSIMHTLLARYDYSNIAGLAELVVTSLTFDYGDFICLFIYPFFALTDGTIQSFILSYFCGAMIPVLLSFYLLGLSLLNSVSSNLRDSSVYRISILIILVCFPLLHTASTRGQPDITGLPFAACILLLTLHYRFEMIDRQRWCVLFILTLCLILSRRWYLFFAVSYYGIYALFCLFYSFLHRNTAAAKNLLIFASISVVAASVLLHQMVFRILNSNYSTDYSAWNMGGFPYELNNQLSFLGIIIAAIILLGFIRGIFHPKLRHISIILMSTYFASLFLFTRIQNFGPHQSLLLIPSYFVGIILFLIPLKFLAPKIRCIQPILASVIMIASMLNCVCFNESDQIFDRLLSSINLYPEKRSDLSRIREVTDFIVANASTNEQVMFLAGSNIYDCSTFINYPQPNANADLIFSNNFYVSSEGFPEEFFDCKYIILIDPNPARVGIVRDQVLSRLTSALLDNPYISSKFSLLQAIPLSGETNAYIYERNTPVDNAEVDVFLEMFSAECAQYKDIFYDKLLSYKTL